MCSLRGCVFQLVAQQAEQFTPRAALRRRCGGGGVLARLPQQGAQALRVAVRVLREPFGKGSIALHEALAPAFSRVQQRGVLGAGGVARLKRGADGIKLLLVQLAHEAANELALAAQRAKVADAARFVQRGEQALGQLQGVELRGGQGHKALTQGLQRGALRLAGGFAGALVGDFSVFRCVHGALIIMGVMTHDQTHDAAPHGGVFSYTQEHFEALADAALAHAKKLGASDAAVSVSESLGLSVTARCGEPETVEHHRGKSLEVTVYLGQQSGSADTADFSAASVQSAVQAAYDIARFTAEDPAAGLPDEALVAQADAQPDLDLFHPWAIDSAQALALALRAERAAYAVDARISNSEGASVWAGQRHFFAAHTHGFRGGFASSSHGLFRPSCARNRQVIKSIKVE